MKSGLSTILGGVCLVVAGVTAPGLAATERNGSTVAVGAVVNQVPKETFELYARSATYFDPSRPGEGIVVELLSEGRAVVYLFSYVAAELGPGGTGQSWMVGVGQQVEGGIVVEELLMPTGGRFGPHFHPDDVVYNNFGSLTFEYPTCGTSTNRGRLVVTPRPGTGFETLVSDNYVQLSQIADCQTGETSDFAYISGSWFDAEREGEGIILHVLEDQRVLLLWWTFDEAGNQMWIEGVGRLESRYNFLFVNETNRYSGTSWGPSFEPWDVVPLPFGRIVIEFTLPNNCANVVLSYQNPRFGSGTLYLERFTELLGVSDYPGFCWDY